MLCESMRRLEQEIKFAVLMKCLSGNIRTWLHLQSSESTSYVTLTEKVLEYDKATFNIEVGPSYDADFG